MLGCSRCRWDLYQHCPFQNSKFKIQEKDRKGSEKTKRIASEKRTIPYSSSRKRIRISIRSENNLLGLDQYFHIKRKNDITHRRKLITPPIPRRQKMRSIKIPRLRCTHAIPLVICSIFQQRSSILGRGGGEIGGHDEVIQRSDSVGSQSTARV